MQNKELEMGGSIAGVVEPINGNVQILPTIGLAAFGKDVCQVVKDGQILAYTAVVDSEVWIHLPRPLSKKNVKVVMEALDLRKPRKSRK